VRNSELSASGSFPTSNIANSQFPFPHHTTIALKHPTFTSKEDMGGKTGNKAGYFDKLKGLLEEYASIFIVSVDNVSSQQMHEIRQSLRGEGVVLMGKNTMVSRPAPGFIPLRLLADL
jgi:hypothetical protein